MPSSTESSWPKNPMGVLDYVLCLLHWQVGSLTLAPPGKHVDLYNRRFTVEIDSHEHKSIKKLHCLLTASWKIRTASGIQFESKGLRTKSSSIGGQEDLDTLAQKKIEWIHPSFTFLFYSGPKWIEWCPQALVKANSILQLPPKINHHSCFPSVSSHKSFFCVCVCVSYLLFL